MNQTTKIFLSCALGGFLGAFVALQVNHHFWWFGLITGFAVGYLSYEFNTVIAALSVAWRETTNWEPDTEWWRAYAALMGRGIVFILGLALASVTIGAMAGVIDVTLWSHSLSHANNVAITFSFPGLFLTVVVTFIVFVCYFLVSPDASAEELRDSEIAFPDVQMFFGYQVAKYAVIGIPCVAFHAIKGAPKAIRAMRKATPKIVSAVVRFTTTYFMLIHSEVRLLCAVDASFGALAGYIFGHALIGAIVGGMLGVLNFEVVSIRVLRVVPATRSLFR